MPKIVISADWETAIGEAVRAMRRRGGPVTNIPVTVMPCEMVLTCKKGTNGKVFRVRCRCQAQTQERPRPGYYNYDWLGEAGSLTEVISIWRKHTRE